MGVGDGMDLDVMTGVGGSACTVKVGLGVRVGTPPVGPGLPAQAANKAAPSNPNDSKASAYQESDLTSWHVFIVSVEDLPVSG
jgi:hypothetical protein